MSEPQSGDVAEGGIAGIWTSGVSDCSVVVVMEWHGRWRRYFFEHVAGSHCDQAVIARARAAIGDAGPRCFGLVAQYYGGSAFNSANDLFDQLGVPPNRRTYYKSNRSGMSFGVRFRNAEFGELPPL